MALECRMVVTEDADLIDYLWECSVCGATRKATQRFEKSKTCPSCNAAIVGWAGVDDVEETEE